MKKTMMGFAVAIAMTAPIAYAEVPVDSFGDALKAGGEYGISHYKDLEFDDDGSVEIEGWLDEEWLVEIDVAANGEVTHEERKRRKDGPWGLQDTEVRQAVEAAKKEGMAMLDEIDVNSNGRIEVEGEDSNGRDVELTINRSELQGG